MRVNKWLLGIMVVLAGSAVVWCMRVLAPITGSACFAEDPTSAAQLQRLKELQGRLGGHATLVKEQVSVGQRDAGAREFPPGEVRLPYKGPGKVSLLDDGTVIIEVGEGEALDPISGERIGEPPKLLRFLLNTSGLRIVEHNRQLFLDRHGVQAKVRGVSPDQRNVTAFRSNVSEEGEEGAEPQTLAVLSGSLSLSLDESSEGLSAQVTDEESRRSLELAGRVVLAGPEETGTATQEPDEITFQPIDAAAGCNACCGTNGEYCCSINCVGSCKAGCSGSSPWCQCSGTK